MNLQNLTAYRGFAISVTCHQTGSMQWQANYVIVFDGLTIFNGDAPKIAASGSAAVRQAIRQGKYLLDAKIEQGGVGILQKYYNGYTIRNGVRKINGKGQWHALVTIEKNSGSARLSHGCPHVPFADTFEAALATGWKYALERIDAAQAGPA